MVLRMLVLPRLQSLLAKMRTVLLLLAVCAVVNSQTQPLCEFDLDEIKTHINASLNGTVTDFVLNCLAHNGSFAESISVSAFTGEDDGMRYDFQCYEGVILIPTLGEVSDVYHHACSVCDPRLADPCRDVDECSSRCGSCQPENQTICITCQYLIDQDGECLENTTCGDLGFEVGETGCECPEESRLQPTEEEPKYLLPNEEVVFKCVRECIAPYDEPMGDENVCYACGIARCVECTNRRTGPNYCKKCIEGYYPEGTEENVNIANKCITEGMLRISEIEEQTGELEDEQHLEDDKLKNNRLLLAVLLPIVCVLTIAVFVGISVFATLWYPHIDARGDKRHKTRPPIVRAPSVWEPSPIVRLR